MDCFLLALVLARSVLAGEDDGCSSAFSRLRVREKYAMPAITARIATPAKISV